MVGVAWTLALLALIALPLMTIGHQMRLVTKNAEWRAAARLNAEAGIAMAIAELLNNTRGSVWRLDGSIVDIEVPGGTAQVSVWDEIGKIDINLASIESLSGLLRASGVSPRDADEMALAIGRARSNEDVPDHDMDRSTTSVLQGKRAALQRGGFETVNELKQLPGMTEGLFQKIRPAVTVHSRQSTVYRATASRLVRKALDGGLSADSEMVDDEVTYTMLRSESNLNGRVFTIQSAAMAGGTARAKIEATVRITTDPVKPYWVLNWEELLEMSKSDDSNPVGADLRALDSGAASE